VPVKKPGFLGDSAAIGEKIDVGDHTPSLYFFDPASRTVIAA
jgi:hypothetical protein